VDVAAGEAERAGRRRLSGVSDDAPRWEALGPAWPNREHSRFLDTSGMRWHVQDFATSREPVALLLHGTGAATHSWRDVAPQLAALGFRVVAPDLPGHGFTSRPPADGRLSLAGMSADVAALLRALDVEPAIVVGHSAGAAIALRMALDTLDGRLDMPALPRAIVGVNAALVPPPYAYAAYVAPWINAIARSGPAARVAAAAASSGVIDAVLSSTGSHLPDHQVELYQAMFRSSDRCSAVLTMMSNWDLPSLVRELPRVPVPLTLVGGDADQWVSCADTERLAAGMPDVTAVRVPGGGHLVHEERPAQVVALVADAARRAGVLAARSGAAT
jgi:magnesium chelatase accessory protein